MRQTPWETEEEFLLLVVRSRRDSEIAIQIKDQIHNWLDWDSLFHAAFHHGLVPVLYQQLNSICLEAVPPDVMNRLRDHFVRNSQRNLFLTGELIGLIGFLDSHGIRALPFKGPLLALEAHKNLSVRQFSDLDLLIRPEDAPKARDLLACHGYRFSFPWTGARLKATLLFSSVYQLVSEDGSVRIDLHWKLLPANLHLLFDQDGLWARSQKISVGGETIAHFSTEDLLLYLCVHGAKHLWERLGWLYDVAELIRTHPQMDWEWLMNQARVLGAERIFSFGLLLAHELLGVELPAEVLQKIGADKMAKVLVEQMRGRIIRGATGPFGMFELFPFYVRMRERWHDKVRDSFVHLLTGMIPTSKEWDRVPLPDSLFPLYYFIRPIRLLGKYAARFARKERLSATKIGGSAKFCGGEL